MRDREKALRSRNRLATRIAETTTLPQPRKAELIDFLLSNGVNLGGVFRILPGLMMLYKGRFQHLGFHEKFYFLQDLQRQLEASHGNTLFHYCRMLELIFHESSGEEVGSKLSIQTSFAARVLETVRSDPYPRVRIAAVLVLIRFRDPEICDFRLNDLLQGLLHRDAVAACAVLRFIMKQYGAHAVKPLILHLGNRHEALPAVLLRLLEMYCEELCKGLDAKWAYMQIKQLSTEQKASPRVSERQVEFGFLASMDRMSKKERNRFPDQDRGHHDQTKDPEHTAESWTVNQVRAETEEDPVLSLERRFSWIRADHAAGQKGGKPCRTSHVWKRRSMTERSCWKH